MDVIDGVGVIKVYDCLGVMLVVNFVLLLICKGGIF